ncbi:MAG: glycosyltransferase family 39 protein [Nitrospiraceae bacterium]|nr:glycosyltransferase family 39 protein [Nitrospiraceae bacterium]
MTFLRRGSGSAAAGAVPWHGALGFFLACLLVFLSVRASDQYRWSDWGFGDAQTMLSLRQWEEGGWLSNNLLFVPQGYAKAGALFDDSPLRHHAHGTCPGSSPRVGPRLRYTHYPAGYLVPYAILFRLGLDSLFDVRMLSILFSVFGLFLMYVVFSKITGPSVAFLAVLFYGLSPAFLGYADALANQPLDDLLRFAFMLAVVLSTRAGSPRQRRWWAVSAWGLEFVLSLASFDSVFFLFAWLIGWDILEERGLRWKTYLLYGLAPVTAHSLQFLQNVWYLGFHDAVVDIKDAFLLKAGADADYNLGQSRPVVILLSIGILLNNLYNPGMLIALLFGLYAVYSWFVKAPDEGRLPSVRLLIVLFFCGLSFVLVLPHAARMPYEARQLLPFAAVLAGGFIWSFVIEFENGLRGAAGPREPKRAGVLRPVYLLFCGVLCVVFWYRFALLDRKPVYYIPDASTDAAYSTVIESGSGSGLMKFHTLRDDVLFAQQLGNIPTAFEPVYFSVDGFRLYWDPEYVKGYPQIMPITEYYAGSRPVLCFDAVDGLVSDLVYMVKKSPYRFSPVLVIGDPAVMNRVVEALQRKGVFSSPPLGGQVIMGRRILDLSDYVRWGGG